MEYVLFLVLGLSVGAIYAALAMGIVLTYQGTGVINFAAAAMATVPLYVFAELEEGRFTLPLPWVPAFEWGTPPLALNILISLVVAALLGALIQVRRVEAAAQRARAGQGDRRRGHHAHAAVGDRPEVRHRVPHAPPVILPKGAVKIGPGQVTYDRIWLTAIVVVLGVVLAVWFRRSRTGLAIQAAAENERAAAFARLSPQTLGMVTWVLASVFTALIMILAGPGVGALAPTNLTLLVVPALAAALIARLNSLWIALVGALGLGVLQAELQYLSGTKEWWPEWAKQGLNDAVPFVVIVIALFLVGRSIPMRGEDVRVGLPPVILPRNRPLVVGLLAVGGLLAVVMTSGSYRFGIITSLSSALIALSLVVLTGMVGQISLAQAAFAGVAGLSLAKIGTGLPFPLSMLAAALIAMVIGIVVGLPALRIRGAQLAVVTLAAALTLERFIFANPQIISPTADLIPNPKLFGIDLSIRKGSNIARLPFGIFVLVVVVVVFVLVGNVMRAGTGRKMLAVRSNERGGGVDRDRGAQHQAAGVRAVVVPRRPRWLVDRLHTRAALAGVVQRVRRSGLPRDRLPGRDHERERRSRGRRSERARHHLRDLRSEPEHGQVLRAVQRCQPHPHRGAEPRRHRRQDASGLRRQAREAAGEEDRRRDAGRRRPELGRPPLDRPSSPPRSAVPATGDRQIGDVLLRTSDITVTYGGLRAVDDVSIEVRAGEIVGLIGPNGAGKTSFIDAITGFTRATGTVVLNGVDLSSATRARAGAAGTGADLAVRRAVRRALRREQRPRGRRHRR